MSVFIIMNIQNKEVKKCSKCKAYKGLFSFGKCKYAKCGLKSQCTDCRKSYNQNNKESISEYKKNYRIKNKEIIANKAKERYILDKESISEYKKNYYQKNKNQIKQRVRKNKEQLCKENREKYLELRRQEYIKNKDRYLAYAKKYNKEHPDSRRCWESKRRAQKLNATMSGFDENIKKIYKNCPKGHHVDHIIPLVNKKVCGLHVPWNLQYLTSEDNLRKSNKLP